MSLDVYPEAKKQLKLSPEEFAKLPTVNDHYQKWYSEALACLTQLLPARVEDFVGYYKPEKLRKDITHANYTISDYLKGLSITRGFNTVVGPSSAVHAMQQQLNIVEAMQPRLESSLFDIRSLVQADLFDNELEAAEELNRKGFSRGAGAVSGVVLEEHLRAICEQRQIPVPKTPSISDLNDRLKKNSAMDLPTWRFIQRLGDLRNLCDHKKKYDPSKEQVADLIEGVRKVIKTVF